MTSCRSSSARTVVPVSILNIPVSTVILCSGSPVTFTPTRSYGLLGRLTARLLVCGQPQALHHQIAVPKVLHRM
ncbi:hypothetical protein EMPG_15122 [Blastomyces silverae]|uniref:Uncharacterized protein n=1 Tax=Blastomyces silverae TaxID=2060906 RepID=A0A0H1BDP9_9EURO|nr:hypothetical protein EMPG_15122 [Blastomyces silverae]